MLRAMEVDTKGWWFVRYGDGLAWVEAPSAQQALRHSLDLHLLGDWTHDARELVVFPQDAYPDHAGPHDYTRAVLNAEPPPLERRRARPRGPGSHLAISCLAAVVALGFLSGVSAETWRGLTVAPEHRCAPMTRSATTRIPSRSSVTSSASSARCTAPSPTSATHPRF